MVYKGLKRLGTCLSLVLVVAATAELRADSSPAATWLANEQTVAAQLMLNNVSAPGTSPGSVIAAPSQTPDYYYHWT